MNAEIVAIGSELLTPFRQDTNSLFLTERLNRLGVEVIFKTVVGDTPEHLVSVTCTALARADVVILMGGLGPTEDDLTRECAAQALGRELKRDPDIVADLYTRFAARRIKMPDNNKRQADVLDGARVLPNPRGSAPGQFWTGEHGGATRTVILLPGPPNELKPMFDESCMELLRAHVPAQNIATRVLKIAMMAESAADQLAAPIYTSHKNVQTTILASAGEIQLHLRARAGTREEAEQRVARLADELEDAFEDHVFSTGEETLEQIVLYYLEMRNATLAAAESCTGGLLAQRITSVSGSSRSFLGGAVVYSNDLKSSMVGVPPLLIAEHGAVSREVAAAMAEGIRKQSRATLGVSVTGIAGPTGGTEAKPVGLVYLALADARGTDVLERRFPGDRERVRMFAAQQALDMVRRKLI